MLEGVWCAPFKELLDAFVWHIKTCIYDHNIKIYQFKEKTELNINNIEDNSHIILVIQYGLENENVMEGLIPTPIFTNQNDDYYWNKDNF